MRLWKGSLTRQIKYMMGIACLVFCTLCIFISRSIKETVYLEADEYTKVNAMHYQNQIALAYDKMETFFMSMGEEPWLQEIFAGSTAEQAAHIHDVEERLAQFKILEPYIMDIALVNDSMHFSNLFHRKKLEELRAGMGDSSFRWAGVMAQEFRDLQGMAPLFVYAGTVYRDTENIGTVVISVDVSFLQGDERALANSYYLLADEKGLIYPIYAPDGREEELFTAWREDVKEGQRIQKPFYIHSAYLPKLDCYLVGFLDTEKIDTNLSEISRLMWICVILLGVLSAALFFVVSRGFVKPLRRFYQAIQEIRSSGRRRLNGQMELDGCSEIEEIGAQFSGMMEDLEKMNQKIFDNATALYETELQKKEAEMALLSSQIDPHFLYNTLEVVRRMAMQKEVPEIADMVVDMGKIFRYSIKGSPTVKLEDEIAIIKSYIHIQQMRFENKISVGYFISEEALSVTVPKMLIQPLVENAIFYGLEPVNQEGILYIGARIEGEDLIVVVKDDGAGIPEEKLDGLQKRLKENSWAANANAHMGIMNVHTRIRMYYGDSYGLSIDSSKEDGTTVTMRLGVRCP